MMRRVWGVLLSLAAVLCAPAAEAGDRLDWSGPYFGVNAGYGFVNSAGSIRGDLDRTGGAGNALVNAVFINTVSFAARTFPTSSPQGMFGGAQAGYNWQFGRMVAGVEADIEASAIDMDFRRSGSVLSLIYLSAALSQRLDWFGTVRARAGYLVANNLQLYVTGGLAYGHTSVSGALVNDDDMATGAFNQTTIDCPSPRAPCLGGADTAISTGWTLGGGLEWAWSANTTLRLEYLHLDLGDQNLLLRPVAPATGTGFARTTFNNNYDIVRIAANLRF